MSQTEATPESTPKSVQLFPLGHLVTLSSGDKLEIRKWSLETMSRVLQLAPKAIDRFTDSIQQAGEANKDLPAIALIPQLLPEMKLIIAETLGWDVARVDRDLDTAEDFVGVLTAVWDHCMLPLMGKVLGLTARFAVLVRQPVKSASAEAGK